MARLRKVRVDGRLWAWKVQGDYVYYRPAGAGRWVQRRVPRDVWDLGRLASLLPNVVRGLGFTRETADQMLRQLTGGRK